MSAKSGFSGLAGNFPIPHSALHMAASGSKEVESNRLYNGGASGNAPLDEEKIFICRRALLAYLPKTGR
jgi:hypothetical protein